MPEVFRKISVSVLLSLAVAGGVSAQKISSEISLLEQKVLKGDAFALATLLELSKLDPAAAKVAAIMYFKGLGVKKDISHGLELFEQSARLGDKESTRFLVKFYSVANSPYRDAEKARTFQALLAENQPPDDQKLPDSPVTYSKPFSWAPFVEPVNEPKSHGSGFAVNEFGNFVTNHHVTDGCSRLVVNYNGKKAYAELVANSKEYDLSIISVKASTPYYLTLRNKTPLIGDKVKAAGYPKGYFKFSEGIVSATQDQAFIFQFSASISSGSSGGPVVDQSAAVVGIASSGYAPGVTKDGGINGADFNFAVDSIYLQKLMATNGLKSHLAINNKAFSESDIAKFLQKTTALIVCY